LKEQQLYSSKQLILPSPKTYFVRLTDNNVNSLVELADVLANGGSADAGVALDSHVVAQGHDDFLDLLGRLAGWGEDQSLAVPQFGVNLLL
jgi:hypothetical protein